MSLRVGRARWLLLLLLIGSLGCADEDKPEVHTRVLLTVEPPITASIFNVSRSGAVRENEYWGARESSLQDGVVRLDILVGEKPIHVPSSVFVGFANVNEFKMLEQSADSGTLEIRGGDAQDGYQSVIVFKDGEVVSRRVEHGEFPDNFYEETRYVNTPVED